MLVQYLKAGVILFSVLALPSVLTPAEALNKGIAEGVFILPSAHKQ